MGTRTAGSAVSLAGSHRLLHGRPKTQTVPAERRVAKPATASYPAPHTTPPLGPVGPEEPSRTAAAVSSRRPWPRAQAVRVPPRIVNRHRGSASARRFARPLGGEGVRATRRARGLRCLRFLRVVPGPSECTKGTRSREARGRCDCRGLLPSRWAAVVVGVRGRVTVDGHHLGSVRRLPLVIQCREHQPSSGSQPAGAFANCHS
jgi:hypothetical protein